MRRVLLTALVLFAAGTLLAGLPAAPAEARLLTNTIDAVATIIGNGHAVKGTVLLSCTAGQQIEFTLTLTQGDTTGTGRGAGVCTGSLASYPVTVSAHGGTFIAGQAEACATAVNREQGEVVDTAEWCRAAGVTLTDD